MQPLARTSPHSSNPALKLLVNMQPTLSKDAFCRKFLQRSTPHG
jgi:hypothetical protein